MSHDLEQAALSRYLEQHSLKHTKQREAILEVFLEATGHISTCGRATRTSGTPPSTAP
jgi:Fe2+ or Zn2+ uptake regulation protein